MITKRYKQLGKWVSGCLCMAFFKTRVVYAGGLPYGSIRVNKCMEILHMQERPLSYWERPNER